MEKNLNKIYESPELHDFICEEFNVNSINLDINEQDIEILSLDNFEINIPAEVQFDSEKYSIVVNVKIDSSDNSIFKIWEKNDLVANEIKAEKLSFDIDYWSYNITYDQLARLFDSGKINIPDMQRGYVWDYMQASKLIESIFMGLPLPSLFLIKQDNSKYLIVDGLQRITTISCFRNNKPLPNCPNHSGFSLKGVNKSINNKTYDDIKDNTELIDRFDMGTINVIEFKQNKPEYEEAMYFLFERLNSGGTTLTAQQIRNSVSYGYFNRKLNEFAKEKIGKYFSIKSNEKLEPSETILRTIAIHEYISDNKMKLTLFEDVPEIKRKKNIVYKNLLNETAEKYHLEYKKIERVIYNEGGDLKFEEHEKGVQYITEIDAFFDRIGKYIDVIVKIFGEDSFRRMEDGKFKSRISPIIVESSLSTLLLFDTEFTLNTENRIREEYAKIFDSASGSISKYENYFTQGTGQIKNVLGRIQTMRRVFFDD